MTLASAAAIGALEFSRALGRAEAPKAGAQFIHTASRLEPGRIVEHPHFSDDDEESVDEPRDILPPAWANDDED